MQVQSGNSFWQPWREIFNSHYSGKVAGKVKECNQNILIGILQFVDKIFIWNVAHLFAILQELEVLSVDKAFMNGRNILIVARWKRWEWNNSFV